MIFSDQKEYDFIVIGAGSAGENSFVLQNQLKWVDFLNLSTFWIGSVVANRLSENPKWKILLLEAGGDPPIESDVKCSHL